MDLMHQKGIGQQSASVHFDIHRFTSYDELKMTFGSKCQYELFILGVVHLPNKNHKERISKSKWLIYKVYSEIFYD